MFNVGGVMKDCAKIMEKCPSLFYANVVRAEDNYSDELVKQIRVTKLPQETKDV